MPRLALLAFACLLGSGCIAQVPHTPDGGLLEELGEGPAAEELVLILRDRVQSPDIVAAEVTGRAFVYHFLGAATLYWGAVLLGEGTVGIDFEAVARVDIYENRKGIMIDRDERKLGHELIFVTLDDARRFADLVASFKTRPPRAQDPERLRRPYERTPADGAAPAPEPKPDPAPGG